MVNPDVADEPTTTVGAQAPARRRHLLAIVDNNAADCWWTQAVLRPLEHCEVRVWRDAREFLADLRMGAIPDLTLVDYRMPVVDGLQVGAALAAAQDAAGAAGAHWVLMTGLADDEVDAQARRLGALDVLTKPLRADNLRMRVRGLLARAEEACGRAGEASASKEPHADRTLFEVLARLAKLRDDTTGSHVDRMARYAVEIAREMSQDPTFLDDLLLAAPLHDIGKVGIPDRILNKRGSLDDDEMAVMRRHSAYGAAVLRGGGSRALTMARRIALSHHEKFDGSGYPQALRGAAIPLEARIVAVADVFDALTTRRPYKEPWPVEEALAHVRAQAGRHFDPDVVAAFERALPRVLTAMQALADPEPTQDDPAPLAA